MSPYPATVPPAAGANPFFPVYYQQYHPAMFRSYTPVAQHFVPVYDPHHMGAIALAAMRNANGHPTGSIAKDLTTVQSKTSPLTSTKKDTQTHTKLPPTPISVASKATSEGSSSPSNPTPESG